ncbi:MAG: methyltransferase family protein [Hyphomicrobiales bacterium]
MAQKKDTAGVLAPPPIIYLVFFVIGLELDYLWPVPLLPKPLQYILGFTIIAASAVLIVWVFQAFSKANTSIDPYKPTTAIISAGPFGFSRNPAYVALTLLFIGSAVAVDSLWIVAMAVPAVLTIHYFVVLREEAYLERKFGDEYRDYKAAVRRWV